MEVTEIETRVRRPEHEPLQYSLATVLLIITFAAACFSAVLAGSGTVRLVVVLVLMVTIPMVLTVLLVYGRGYLRTFCIGALFPSGVFFLGGGSQLVNFLRFRKDMDLLLAGNSGDVRQEWLAIAILIYGAVILVFGLVAVLIRWRLEAPRRESQLQTQPYWDDLPVEESQPGDVCE